MESFVVLGPHGSTTATREGAKLWLDAKQLFEATGFERKEAGLCRGSLCVAARNMPFVQGERVDLVGLADTLGWPLALDEDERVAAVVESAASRGRSLERLELPPITLPDLAGKPVSVSDFAGKKRLLVVWASWCGCRFELPAWQALHSELEKHNFTVIAVALDEAEDARPWIEGAGATFPALIDRDRTLCPLLGVVNVPTVLWIDEAGRMVRPPDVAFTGEQFVYFTGVEPGPHLEALRAWVTENRAPFANEQEAAAALMAPTSDEQRARAEHAVALHLARAGRTAAARKHVERAAKLSPDDFTIRRGMMTLLGDDPFGDAFAVLYAEWETRGRPYYRPRAPEPG